MSAPLIIVLVALSVAIYVPLQLSRPQGFTRSIFGRPSRAVLGQIRGVPVDGRQVTVAVHRLAQRTGGDIVGITYTRTWFLGFLPIVIGRDGITLSAEAARAVADALEQAADRDTAREVNS